MSATDTTSWTARTTTGTPTPAVDLRIGDRVRLPWAQRRRPVVTATADEGHGLVLVELDDATQIRTHGSTVFAVVGWEAQ